MKNAGFYLPSPQQGVVVFDGGMGTQIQVRDLNAEDYGGGALEGAVDYLSLTRQDVSQETHRSYLDPGAQAVGAPSFQVTAMRD